MTQATIKLVIAIVAFLMMVGVVFAGLPALKEYQLQSHIERLQNMQEEQHNLATESRNRENQYRQQILELITLAEREEEIQNVHGARWNALQEDILFFKARSSQK